MNFKHYSVLGLSLIAGAAMAQAEPPAQQVQEEAAPTEPRQVRDLTDRGALLLEDEAEHRLRIQALERQIAIAEREKRLELERKAKREAEEQEEQNFRVRGGRGDSTMPMTPPPPPVSQNRNFTPPPAPTPPKKAPNLAGVVGNMAVFTVDKALIRARAGQFVDGFRVDMVTPSEVILSRDNNGERDETRISLEF